MTITPARQNWNSPPDLFAIAAGEVFSAGFGLSVPLGQYLHGFRVTGRVDGSNWPGMVIVTADNIGAAFGPAPPLPVDPFDPATQLEGTAGVGDVLVELYVPKDTRTVTNIATAVLPLGANLVDIVPALSHPIRLRHVDILTTAAGGEADLQTSGGSLIYAAPGAGSGLWSRDFGPAGLEVEPTALPLQVQTLAGWQPGRVTVEYEQTTSALERGAGKTDTSVAFAVAGPSIITAWCAVRNDTGDTASVPGFAWSLHYLLSDQPLNTWG